MKSNYILISLYIFVLTCCGQNKESQQEAFTKEAEVARQLTLKDLFSIMHDSISLIESDIRNALVEKGFFRDNEFEYSMKDGDNMISVNAGNMDNEYIYNYVMWETADKSPVVAVLKRSTGYCGGDCPEGKPSTLSFGLYIYDGINWRNTTEELFPEYELSMLSNTHLAENGVVTSSSDETLITEWGWNGTRFERSLEYSSIESILGELNGIEKFYVGDDLRRLHSLLRYKEDKRHKILGAKLKAQNSSNTSVLNVTLLDAGNGYIEFSESQNECDEVMVYWNKTNGEKLIGHAVNCCTMFCEGSVSFMTYDPGSKRYTKMKNSDIIKNLDLVMSLRPDGFVEADGGYDYQFILPQKGKNIRYCVTENKCLDLIWQDGTFIVEVK